MLIEVIYTLHYTIILMNILLAIDHFILRHSLTKMLNEHFVTPAISEADNVNDFENFAFSQKWDVIIADVILSGQSTLSVIKTINHGRLRVTSPIIIFSAEHPKSYVMRLFKLKISAFLTKSTKPDELIEAITTVINGKKYIPLDIAEIIEESLQMTQNDHYVLSNRELQVLKLIASGKESTQVAEILALNVHTVCTYKKRILDKMQLQGTADLVKYAVQKGMAWD